MDDDPTQPTQNILDPRRIGQQNSGFSDDDISDILCLLVPASAYARRELADMASRHACYLVGRHEADLVQPDYDAEDRPDRFAPPSFTGDHSIMLRLSDQSNDPRLGFVFGRNPDLCDVYFVHDRLRRLSNVHFRIFVNEYGTVMIEDQSTNGTFVDTSLLKRREGHSTLRTLESGSVIRISLSDTSGVDLSFVVRIPRRDGAYLTAYETKFEDYFQRLQHFPPFPAPLLPLRLGLPTTPIQATDKTGARAAQHALPPAAPLAGPRTVPRTVSRIRPHVAPPTSPLALPPAAPRVVPLLTPRVAPRIAPLALVPAAPHIVVPDRNGHVVVFRQPRHHLYNMATVPPTPPPTSRPPDPPVSPFVVASPQLRRRTRGQAPREWRGSSDYSRVCTIGKGAFAVVYKVTSRLEGIPYAAKELDKQRFIRNGVLDRKVENEMHIMQKIRHPHIVKYIEHFEWEDNLLIIIMEYMPGGDLGKLVSDSGRLLEHDVQTMADQMLSALNYLHANNITHRDIKPDNILIKSLEPVDFKLSDFGLSKMVNDQTFLRTFCGTLLYCAPEVYSEFSQYDADGFRLYRDRRHHHLTAQRYDEAVDVWSLGGVLFFALTAAPPYPVRTGISHSELLHQIMTTPLDTGPLVHYGVSSDGMAFLLRMLHRRPESRASVGELQTDRWIRPAADGPVPSAGQAYDTESSDVSTDDEELEIRASQLSLGERCRLGRKDKVDKPNVEAVDTRNDAGRHDLDPASSDEMHEDGSYGYSSGKENCGETDGETGSESGDEEGDVTTKLFGEVDAAVIGSTGAVPAERLNLLVSESESEEASFTTELLELDFVNSVYSANRSGSRREEDHPPSSTEPPFWNSRPQSLDDLRSLVGGVASQSLGGYGGENVGHQAGQQSGQQSGHQFRHQVGHQAEQAGQAGQAEADCSFMSGRDLDAMDGPAIKDSSLGALTANGQKDSFEGGIRWAASEPCLTEINTSIKRKPSSESEPYGEGSALKRLKSGGISSAEVFPELVQADIRLLAVMPPLKRLMSGRLIDGPIDKKSFWGVDPASWHLQYPEMTQLQHGGFVQAAKNAGEVFGPGRDSLYWDIAMRYFPSTATTNRSERANVKQEEKVGAVETAETGEMSGQHQNSPVVVPVRQPGRVLALLESDSMSAVQGISVAVAAQVVSWGRAEDNLQVYVPSSESKVPKHAFRVVLWREGYDGKDSSKVGPVWERDGAEGDDGPEASSWYFYISTKATHGIWVNGQAIPSHEPRISYSPAVHWARLQDGDRLTVWGAGGDSLTRTCLVFRCFWGGSASSRPAAGPGGGVAAVVVEPTATGRLLDMVSFRWEKRIKLERVKALRNDEAAQDMCRRRALVERERARSRAFEVRCHDAAVLLRGSPDNK